MKDTISDFATGAAAGAFNTVKDGGLSVKVELDIPADDKMLAAGLLNSIALKGGNIANEGILEIKKAADRIEYRWKITQYLLTVAVVGQLVALLI